MSFQFAGKNWLWLRIAVLVAALIGVIFWIGSLISWWLVPTSHRDGLELMGLVIATGIFVVLVLPTLVLGAAGRGLPFSAILGVIVLIIVSDDLIPWVPWAWIQRP